MFTSSAAKQITSSALDVGKEGAKKALEVRKSAAVDVGKKLVTKALTPKSKKILQKYTESTPQPTTQDINTLVDGSAIAIQDLVKKLNRLTIETQDIFAHPSKSFLIIEGRLIRADNNSYGNDDRITLTNNGIMHLFKHIRYDLSGQEIESITDPGQATTMLGLLKYPDDFFKSKGLNQLWYKDTTTDTVLNANVGFKIRQEYIIKKPDPKSTFIFKIPLKHIFGFCEDYDKVVYGLKHNLTLTRNNDNDSIFRYGGDDRGACAVDAGKVILSKISWFMPHVTPADKDKMELYTIIERKEKIPVGY